VKPALKDVEHFGWSIKLDNFYILVNIQRDCCHGLVRYITIEGMSIWSFHMSDARQFRIFMRVFLPEKLRSIIEPRRQCGTQNYRKKHRPGDLRIALELPDSFLIGQDLLPCVEVCTGVLLRFYLEKVRETIGGNSASKRT